MIFIILLFIGLLSVPALVAAAMVFGFWAFKTRHDSDVSEHYCRKVWISLGLAIAMGLLDFVYIMWLVDAIISSM